MFILTSLLESELWFAVSIIALSTFISFVFYGRILIQNWFLFVSEYAERPVAAQCRPAVVASTATAAHVFLPISLIVVSLVFIFSFIFIGGITQILGFLSIRFISPVFRSTEHRNSFIITALTTASSENPNAHLFYSWGSLYWFLPLWHYMAWGESPYLRFRTAFASPHEPILIPKLDSRYFWIGEWLMYPWWIAGEELSRREVGPVFEGYFRPWIPQVRGWLYHLTTSSG